MSLLVSNISNSLNASYKPSFRGKLPSEQVLNASKKVRTGDKINNAMGIAGWALLISALVGSLVCGIKAAVVDKQQKQDRTEMIYSNTNDVVSAIDYDSAKEMVSNQ